MWLRVPALGVVRPHQFASIFIVSLSCVDYKAMPCVLTLCLETCSSIFAMANHKEQSVRDVFLFGKTATVVMLRGACKEDTLYET